MGLGFKGSLVVTSVPRQIVDHVEMTCSWLFSKVPFKG